MTYDPTLELLRDTHAMLDASFRQRDEEAWRSRRFEQMAFDRVEYALFDCLERRRPKEADSHVQVAHDALASTTVTPGVCLDDEQVPLILRVLKSLATDLQKPAPNLEKASDALCDIRDMLQPDFMVINYEDRITIDPTTLAFILTRVELYDDRFPYDDEAYYEDLNREMPPMAPIEFFEAVN